MQRFTIESDAIDCTLLLHPYFNLVSNHQVPLNFVSFDTLLYNQKKILNYQSMSFVKEMILTGDQIVVKTDINIIYYYTTL